MRAERSPLSTNWRDLVKYVREGNARAGDADAARWFGALTGALAKLHRCAVLMIFDAAVWHNARQRAHSELVEPR
jgi:hypothetical protein